MTDASDYGPRDWSSHPPSLHPDYRSTALRSPSKPLVRLPQTLTELTGPVFGQEAIGDLDNDLVRNGAKTGEPQGQRINVVGRVLDEAGRPVPHTLIEIWQANACGRYIHVNDPHKAPLDPNFYGAGRAVTDAEGRYRFRTIRPGAYPWGNHHNAWRPAHIHFSLFGQSFVTRLVTQMYFPDDSLFPFDPIFNACADPAARQRMVAAFSLELTDPNEALGYSFDIVLRGPLATPMEA
jgi:protocatechuate 3,4-dioxygenase beta subunit